MVLEQGGRRTLPGAAAFWILTAIFAVGYLAFSVPALIAGVTAAKFGLHATALVYSAAVAVLVVAATGVLLVRRSAVSGS